MYRSNDENVLLDIIATANEALDRDTWINNLYEQLQSLEADEFATIFDTLDKDVTCDVINSDRCNASFSIDTLTEKITQWAKDRKIIPNSSPTTQCMKAMSELGELADNIIKGEDVKDSIGDVYVTLCGVAALSNVTIEECVETAYEDIKDRKGVLLTNGNFLKSTDPQYLAMVERGEI